MQVSDKIGSNGIIVRKNDILFSCKIDYDLKKTSISAKSALLRRLLTHEVDKKINKDTLTCYALAYILNKKHIDWIENDLFYEIEFLKKRIIANAALKIYSSQKLTSSKSSDTVRADGYYSLEEYILIDILSKYIQKTKEESLILEPKKHNSTFLEFLDWAYANKHNVQIHDIFKMYYEGVFYSNSVQIEKGKNKTVDLFLDDLGFNGDNGVFFTTKETIDKIPIYEIMKIFNETTKTDWFIFFQTLQKLKQKGVVDIIDAGIVKKNIFNIFSGNVSYHFNLYIEEFSLRSLFRLIRNITKQKKVFCKCGGLLSFSSDFVYCNECQLKYKKKSYGKKLTNWQTLNGLYTGQILYFSEKFANFMVLYAKQTSVSFFEFQNKDR